MGQRSGSSGVVAFRHQPLFLLCLVYGGTCLIALPYPDALPTLVALAPALLLASLSDLDRHVIPDKAVIWVAGVGLLYPFLKGAAFDAVTFGIAVIVTIALGLVGEWYWRRNQTEALGLGDAKLIGAGTLVVGAENLWLMILLAATGGLVAGLLARQHAQRGIPFGPFLAYAIFVTVAASGGERTWQ